MHCSELSVSSTAKMGVVGADTAGSLQALNQVPGTPPTAKANSCLLRPPEGAWGPGVPSPCRFCLSSPNAAASAAKLPPCLPALLAAAFSPTPYKPRTGLAGESLAVAAVATALTGPSCRLAEKGEGEGGETQPPAFPTPPLLPPPHPPLSAPSHLRLICSNRRLSRPLPVEHLPSRA